MIRLNAGFGREVGEANFGSRGASVNLELELETAQVAGVRIQAGRQRHQRGE